MDNLYKNILITGASSGIGEGLAIFYAQNGAENLFICGRNKERLKLVAEKCRKFCKNVFEEVLDVTDKKKTFAWVEKCNKKSALDLVVANAGIGTCDDSHEATYQTFDVNIFGVLNTSLPAIEAFKKNTKTLKIKTTWQNSATITKLKKKKTYYIRVRGYNKHGKGNWSKTMKVKLK